jgi:hypothetical protein
MTAVATMMSVAPSQAVGAGLTPTAVGQDRAATPGLLSSHVATKSALQLPIEQYLPGGTQLAAINRAGNALVSQCMASFGYQFNEPAENSIDPGQMDRRYGVMDLASARNYGYHPAPADQIYSKRVDQAYTLAGQPAESLVLSGAGKPGFAAAPPMRAAVTGKAIPSGGCVGASARALNGNAGETVATGLGIAARVNDSSFVAAKTEPAVKAALRQWSACMVDHGYRVSDPLTAIASANLRSSVIPRAEIAMALTDVGCKQRTNLIQVWFAAESALQRAAIKQNAPVLTGLVTKVQDVLARAAKVTAAMNASSIGRTAGQASRLTSLVHATTPAGYEQDCQNSYGDNCFAYADQMRGGWIGAYTSIPDFASPAAYFDHQCHSGNLPSPNDCTGQGQPLWNDAASDWNMDRTVSVRVWYNQNYSGPSYTLSSANGGYNVIDLPEQDPTMLNNNRSQSFL